MSTQQVEDNINTCFTSRIIYLSILRKERPLCKLICHFKLLWPSRLVSTIRLLTRVSMGSSFWKVESGLWTSTYFKQVTEQLLLTWELTKKHLKVEGSKSHKSPGIPSPKSFAPYQSPLFNCCWTSCMCSWICWFLLSNQCPNSVIHK